MATYNNLKRRGLQWPYSKVTLPASLVAGEDYLRVGTVNQPEVNF